MKQIVPFVGDKQLENNLKICIQNFENREIMLRETTKKRKRDQQGKGEGHLDLEEFEARVQTHVAVKKQKVWLFPLSALVTTHDGTFR